MLRVKGEKILVARATSQDPNLADTMLELSKAIEEVDSTWTGGNVGKMRGNFRAAHIGYSFGGGQTVRTLVLSLWLS